MNISVLIFVILFSLFLSACQSNPLSSSDINDESASLSTQYADVKSGAPTAAEVNTELGAGYIDNGRYDRALLKLKKALNYNPDYMLAHNYIAILYNLLERPNLARKHFIRAIELDPYDSSVRNNYGVFLCEQKEYKEAEEQLKIAYNNPLYINRDKTYQSAAWCAYLEGDYLKADEYYRKALKQNPSLARSMLGLARISYKQKNYPLAWNYYRQFDAMSVQFADSLWLGINILKQLNDPDRNALASFKFQLENKFPGSEEAKMYFLGKQEY